MIKRKNFICFLFFILGICFSGTAEDFIGLEVSDEKLEKAKTDLIEVAEEAPEKSLEETAGDVVEIIEELFKKDQEEQKYGKPGKRRPNKPDPEKVEEAAKKDESEKTASEYRSTIQYGIAGEITELIDKLNKNEDPRFTEEIYDLFQITRSVEVKEKILGYFGKLKDPCLEEYAVTVIDDPFDEKKSTVKACFQYVQDCKCTSAVPGVLRLIENENEDYFNDALLTIGDIGGPEEALKLTEYLDKEDLKDAQKQSLMRTLGKIHAVETWDKLVEIAQDDDENMFVRMYASEAIGAMEKLESVPVLVELFESNDPNLRQYVLKGLEYYPDVLEAKAVIVQAVRDDHYKVRLEAIEAVKNQEIMEAMPYLIYRAKNDPEEKIKMKSFEVIAALNTQEGNDFLIERITEKKANDNQKAKAVEVLLKEKHTGEAEIKELALKIVEDDKRKTLRQALGKHLAKYPRPEFEEVCIKYLESKDATTQSQGLEMYQNGKYEGAKAALKKIAEDKKANSGNRKRARRLLGMEEE